MKISSFTTTHNGIARELKSEVLISTAFDPSTDQPPTHLQKYVALWDTGATNSVVSTKVVKECGLKPIGMTQVTGIHENKLCKVYLISIKLPSNVGFTQVRVTEGTPSGVDVIIGMDIINSGDFAITNKNGKTIFTFRTPSVGTIDFVKNPHLPLNLPATSSKIGRNNKCPCGSGKKYKHCCGK